MSCLKTVDKRGHSRGVVVVHAVWYFLENKGPLLGVLQVSRLLPCLHGAWC